MINPLSPPQSCSVSSSKLRPSLWRLTGLGLLAGAYGSSLVHRDLVRVTGAQSAAPLEMALSLLSFLLASFGALLLIHGPRLHDRWRKELRRHTDIPVSAKARHTIPEGRVPAADLLTWRTLDQPGCAARPRTPRR